LREVGVKTPLFEYRSQKSEVICRRRETKVLPSCRCSNSSPRGSNYQTLSDEERFHNSFNRFCIFTNGNSERRNTNWSPGKTINQYFKDRTVQTIKTSGVYVIQSESIIDRI
jgi:hypothetical protein